MESYGQSTDWRRQSSSALLTSDQNYFRLELRFRRVAPVMSKMPVKPLSETGVRLLIDDVRLRPSTTKRWKLLPVWCNIPQSSRTAGV